MADFSHIHSGRTPEALPIPVKCFVTQPHSWHVSSVESHGRKAAKSCLGSVKWIYCSRLSVHEARCPASLFICSWLYFLAPQLDNDLRCVTQLPIGHSQALLWKMSLFSIYSGLRPRHRMKGTRTTTQTHFQPEAKSRLLCVFLWWLTSQHTAYILWLSWQLVWL